MKVADAKKTTDDLAKARERIKALTDAPDPDETTFFRVDIPQRPPEPLRAEPMPTDHTDIFAGPAPVYKPYHPEIKWVEHVEEPLTKREIQAKLSALDDAKKRLKDPRQLRRIREETSRLEAMT